MKNPFQTRNFIIAAVPILFSSVAIAALIDETQVNDNGAIAITDGTITRSLTDQIGTGTGDQYTPYSSAYIIRHDPLRSVRRGRQLFQRKFSNAEGIGPRDNFSAHGDITQNRRLGAGSTDSCSTCHGSPKGSAGFGGNVATFPDGRDAPHLFGLGIVEQLAEEITESLRFQRQVAIDTATKNNRSHQLKLSAKGITYGSITAHPDGTVDTSRVNGIDEDLRVKPFFAQGQTISMREFIIGAFKDEMGMESWDPVLCAATDPDNPQLMVSQSGFVFDPTQDEFERPANCDEWFDNDSDGIIAELDPSLVDHLEFYLLNYFKPATGERNRFTNAGRRHLDRIGCTGCHKSDLVIDSDRRVADVDTQYDPVNGIFNDLFSTASGLFDVVDEGAEHPAILPQNKSFTVTEIFTDLKRHDLGPNFHEA